MRRIQPRALLPALAIALGTMACESVPEESSAWSSAFQNRNGFGWSGGDGAYSIPLPDSRTLWLFGDSYLSDVKSTGRTDSTLRFGSTIAVQYTPRGPVPPLGSDFSFDWGPPNSNGWLPVEWDVMQDPSAPESVEKARADSLKLLAWPLHGMTVGIDLVLFTLPITPFACDDCGGPGIKVHGSVASIIRGVDKPYSEWGFQRDVGWSESSRPEQQFVPHSRATPPLEDASWTFWGNVVMRDPNDTSGVYVYGHRRQGDANSAVVAHVPGVALADDLVDFGRWTFWNGTEWVTDPDQAVAIADDSATETSVVAVPAEYGTGYALVETNHSFSTELKVSLAEQPWGPFTQKYVMSLADCPVGGFDATRDITYAGKAHPGLSTGESLLASLVIVPKPGTTDPILLTDPHLYVPKFVDLPWVEVFAYEHSSNERCSQ